MRLPSLFKGNNDLMSFNSEWDDFFAPTARLTSSLWHEDKDKFYLEYDLPGLEKQDIKISCQKGVLQVKAVREFKNSYGTSKKQYNFISYLPESVNEEKIEAEYSNGVLKISVPKEEVLKEEKYITVK